MRRLGDVGRVAVAVSPRLRPGGPGSGRRPRPRRSDHGSGASDCGTLVARQPIPTGGNDSDIARDQEV